MSANKQQALSLSYLAEQFLFNYIKNKREQVFNLHFLNFVNDHDLQKNLFSCPACCGSLLYCGSFAKKGKQGLIPIYFCDVCGTVIISPTSNVYSTLDQNTMLFNQDVNLETSLKLEEKTRGLANKILDSVPFASKKIFEIGCGVGFLLHEASKRGIEGVGYDVAPDLIKYGKEKLLLDLRDEALRQDSSVDYFDLLISLVDFSHIITSDKLASIISMYCKKYSAPALLRASLAEDMDTIVDSLKDSYNARSLFYNPPSIYYSRKGFAKFWQRHGAVNISALPMKDCQSSFFLIKF